MKSCHPAYLSSDQCSCWGYTDNLYESEDEGGVTVTHATAMDCSTARLESVSEYGYVLIYTLVYVCGCACMCMYVISVCIRFWANTSVHISRKMIERRYWCPVRMSKSIQNVCDQSSETTAAQLNLPHSQHRLSLNEANLFIKHCKANCISTIIFFVKLAVWQAPHWLDFTEYCHFALNRHMHTGLSKQFSDEVTTRVDFSFVSQLQPARPGVMVWASHFCRTPLHKNWMLHFRLCGRLL